MNPQPWQLWAYGSAAFAALTALLAKVGVRGVDSNLAMAIRSVVILCAPWKSMTASSLAAPPLLSSLCSRRSKTSHGTPPTTSRSTISTETYS